MLPPLETKVRTFGSIIYIMLKKFFRISSQIAYYKIIIIFIFDSSCIFTSVTKIKSQGQIAFDFDFYL